MNRDRKQKKEGQKRWQNWTLLVVELLIGGTLLVAMTEELALRIKAEGKAGRQ